MVSPVVYFTLKDLAQSNPPQTSAAACVRSCVLSVCVTGHVCADFSFVVVFDHRVFVNRSLTLENIKCYGFDMDYTMASMSPQKRCVCV